MYRSEKLAERMALRPTLSIWPPKRRRAVLWILVHFVVYPLHEKLTLVCQDCDFLQRAKWKLHLSVIQEAVATTRYYHWYL
jgi:hypothetical protein